MRFHFRQLLTWRLLIVGSGILFLLLLIVYMGGFFTTGLVGPEDQVRPLRDADEPFATAVAESREITEYFEAVGTIGSRARANLEAQVTARVMAVNADPGDQVQEGEVLIILDDRQLQARQAQAEQGLAAALARQQQASQELEAAKAAFGQAESQLQRVETYFAAEAATAQTLEEAQSAFLQAQADRERAVKGVEQARAAVRQARSMLEETEITLGYATLPAPVSGEVAERLVDPGDMAVPGRPLLVLQVPEGLRLEVRIPEGLIGSIKPGQQYRASINALDTELVATIEEVSPAADPGSRTFLVKAGLPALPGFHPGMFGRLFIPVSKQRVILIPRRAVVTIGQLQVVRVRENGEWRQIAVLTGREYDAEIEVLSGLSGGEIIALTGDGNG
jgi:HlyD family secretion protein